MSARFNRIRMDTDIRYKMAPERDEASRLPLRLCRGRSFHWRCTAGFPICRGGTLSTASQQFRGVQRERSQRLPRRGGICKVGIAVADPRFRRQWRAPARISWISSTLSARGVSWPSSAMVPGPTTEKSPAFQKRAPSATRPGTQSW